MRTQKINRLFASIRSKFLVFFIASMSVVLIFGLSLAYKKIYDTMTMTNKRNAESEIKQIALNINSLYANMTRQTDSILYSDYMTVIKEYSYYPSVRVVYSIKDFYAAVKQMIMNFPYIHSIYVFLENDYVLCGTSENMQRFMAIDPQDYPVLNNGILCMDERNLVFTGGMTSEDFPFNINPITYTADKRKNLISAIRCTREYTIVINVLEEEFKSFYYGLSEKESWFLRLTDMSGRIISSKNSNEIGSMYVNSEIIMETEKGSYSDNRNQIIWEKMPDRNMIIASEVLLNEYFSDLTDITYTLLFTIIPGFIITCILFYLWLGRAFKPLIALRKNMEKLGLGYRGDLLPVQGHDELSLLIMNYNEMIMNLRTLTEQKETIEKEKREGELKALRNQINPHFIFNTLSTIKWMCLLEGNKKAGECISLLSKMISPMFKTDNPVWTLREETELVDLFIEIMNLRLDEKIQYEKNIDDDLLDIKVLRFIIQPLVENAITHGFEKKNFRGMISLEILKDEEHLFICVKDNGRSMDAESIKSLNEKLFRADNKGGIGLMNTNQRLKLRYGDEFGVVVAKNEPEGLMVTMKLPIDP